MIFLKKLYPLQPIRSKFNGNLLMKNICLLDYPCRIIQNDKIGLTFQPRFYVVNLSQTGLMTNQQHQGDIMKQKRKKEKDRYGIFLITDVDELFELSRNRRIQLSFNDYVAIFLRVTELRLDTSLIHLYGISEVFKKIEKEIVKEDEEEPSIGRLSLCLQRSKICKDISFWVNLSDHILDNRFDCDHDEVYAAMIGFNGVREYCRHEWQLQLIEKVYLKLEIALIHHVKMQKYNIKTLRLICDVMYQNNRLTPDFLKEIEFLLNHQLMEASNKFGSNEDILSSSRIRESILYPQYGKQYLDQLLQLLASFAYFFAKAHFDSLLLFNFTTLYVEECLKRQNIFAKLQAIRREQIASAKEELENNPSSDNIIPEEITDPLKLDGPGLAGLLDFWAYMLSANPGLVLSGMIRSWMLIELQREELEYEVEHLNTIYKNLDLLGLDESSKLNFQLFLEKKLFEVDLNSLTLKIEHVKEYIDLRMEQNQPIEPEIIDEQNNSEIIKEKESLDLINRSVFKFLDQMCAARELSFAPYSMYFFVHHIEEHDLLRFFPKFLNELPGFLLKTIDMYEFDEICFFVMICHRDAHLLDQEDTSIYWANLHLAKEHIKSIAFNRGFKLDPSSYFSQLLHVVDMAEFFNGGEN